MVAKSSKVPSKTRKKGAVAKEAKFSKEVYIKWYKDMLLMRQFEVKSNQLYLQQEFGGFCHLYSGQEAILAGTMSACRPTDLHISAYRTHCHPIAMGRDVRPLMAELYGKATGIAKGKGGSMHFFDVEKGFYGGQAIVGAQIPLGAGLAFAEKYKGTDNVVFTSFGDGAARQGALHETFNMAMTWKLPVIFIIENNNYAMGTSVERTTNVLDLSKIGASYEMPSFTVDGMRPEPVHEAIAMAASRARKGEGPTLLNIMTYRYKGHSLSDAGKYRTKQEVDEYKEKDPLAYVLGVIKGKKFLKESEIKAIQDWVKNEIEEAVQFAKNSPELEKEELYTDIYKSEYPYIVEY